MSRFDGRRAEMAVTGEHGGGAPSRRAARRPSVALVLASAAMVLAACNGDDNARAAVGDVENGRLLLEQYACGTCHVIPGVPMATGQLAPPLESYSRHVYIAGKLPNDPATLSRWIQDPQALVPGTTMPDLGVHEVHARDMVAYLYQLP